MAGSVQVRMAINVSNGNLIYQSQPTTFTVQQLVAIGPTPGALEASIHGTQISLAQLLTPGLTLLANIDPENYYQWGPYLPIQDLFIPVGVVYPGQIYLICLDPYFGRAEGTDSGTDPHESGIQLWLKAIGGPCQAVVSSFNE